MEGIDRSEANPAKPIWGSWVKPTSLQQEGMCNAYLQAVAATAGCSLAKPEPDDQKVDWTVRWQIAQDIAAVDLQLKSVLVEGEVTGSLQYWCADLGPYQLLRHPLPIIPRVLVLLLLPPDTNAWFEAHDTATRLGCCAYWVSLRGHPPTSNRSGITITVPAANRFTPAALRVMMDRALRREPL